MQEQKEEVSLAVVLERVNSVKELVLATNRKIDDHLVTKDQLKLHVSEERIDFHKNVIDPMQRQIDATEIKANWAMRFVTIVLSAVGLAVLGAVLGKLNLQV